MSKLEKEEKKKKKRMSKLKVGSWDVQQATKFSV